ncbi:acyltransferase [Granulicella mallensis]|uniref:Peptidoglycan/LPS O-acetylase OafA/YrhL n=1 Tax=Granulicella mallensis TaxID=940614 RepID=A0A7W7ZMN5_9BACT|nr:acyltransferase [Granulicella mallensis]MBB5062412.1 peptidoglycan/LPS O-acetylase OafA/YrhL [Granulicella mallensis]
MPQSLQVPERRTKPILNAETNRPTSVVATPLRTLPQGLQPSRNIPSLDGLRAFSILLVIFAHSSWYLPSWITQNSIFHSVIGNGYHGVAVFFVISGYLITTLLLREFDKTRTVSLKHFYFRRTLRIFPPFYFFLGIMGILWAIHVIPEDPRSFIASLTYTWAYYPGAHGYFITHTWSLSIEEQFYLIWPLLFVFLHRRSKLIAASALFIVAMPFIRVLFYFILPNLRGHEFYMVHGWIDTMMVGCLLALVKHQGKWKAWQQRYINGWTVSAMAIIAFYINPVVTAALPKRSSGIFALGISPTVTAFCIGGILMYLTSTGNPLILRLFNNRAIRHVGVLSYSLYLWQQLFMSHQFSFLPYGYLYAFAIAECSFWLVEKPSLHLRAKLEATWWPIREPRGSDRGAVQEG